MVGRRPIPKERAAPFRRPAAAGTLGRPWSGLDALQDGSDTTVDQAISVRTQSAESAESPQLSQIRSPSANTVQPENPPVKWDFHRSPHAAAHLGSVLGQQT